MYDRLQTAYQLAERIRFSGDVRTEGETVVTNTDSVKDFFLINELHIAQAVTPSLHSSLTSALENLLIPPDTVAAFVHASSEMQAMCYPGDERGCVIRFSSALVDILDNEEFKFVAGHELGHFLFRHRKMEDSMKKNNLGYFMQQRAQEISCDRMGLIACGGSLNAAIKALMKAVSGLTGAHIRFDVGAFLSQLQKSSGNPLNNVQDTHPSILVRCRALLWFSLNDYFVNNSGSFLTEQLLELDGKVQKDLSKYVDGPVKKWINEAKKNVKMWKAVRAIVQDYVFAKEEQQQFADDYGQDKLEKVKRFLDMPASEVKSAVERKLEDAIDRLKELTPMQK